MNDMTGLHILVVSAPYLLLTCIVRIYCILHCGLQTKILMYLILPWNI